MIELLLGLAGELLKSIAGDHASIAVGGFLVASGFALWLKLAPAGDESAGAGIARPPRLFLLGLPVFGVGVMIYGIFFEQPATSNEPQRVGGHIAAVPAGVIFRTRGSPEQNQLWASYWWESDGFSVQWMLMRTDPDTGNVRKPLRLQLTHYADGPKRVFTGDTSDYTTRLSLEQRSRLRNGKAEFELEDRSRDDRDPHFRLFDKLASGSEPATVVKFVLDQRLTDAELALQPANSASNSETSRPRMPIARLAMASAYAGSLPPTTEKMKSGTSPASGGESPLAMLGEQLIADSADARSRAVVTIKRLIDARDPKALAWLNGTLLRRGGDEHWDELVVSLLYAVRAIVNEARARDDRVKLFDNAVPVVGAIETETLESLVRASLVLEGSPIGQDVRRYLRAIRDERVPSVFEALAAHPTASVRGCISAVEQNIYYNWQIAMLEQVRARAQPITRDDIERLFTPIVPFMDRATRRITTPAYRVQSVIGAFGTGYVYASLLADGDNAFAAHDRSGLQQLAAERSLAAFRQFVSSSETPEFGRIYRFPWHAQVAYAALVILEGDQRPTPSTLEVHGQPYKTTQRDFSCRLSAN